MVFEKNIQHVVKVEPSLIIRKCRTRKMSWNYFNFKNEEDYILKALFFDKNYKLIVTRFRPKIQFSRI